MNVTVVTVTYGKRAHLLTQVLDAAREQGVVGAVVIDNGSADPISEILSLQFGNWAHVVCLGANRGSGLAFKRGIETAIGKGAEYILILDDDNIPQLGCVDALLASHQKFSNEGITPIAVCGYREKFHQKMLENAKAGKRLRRSSQFNGVHFIDLPQRILNRIKPRKQVGSNPRGEILALEFCTYGGMLFSTALIEQIGYPDLRFFLYEDYEFTQRIRRRGGKIFLVCDAKINDIVQTWTDNNASRIRTANILYTTSPSLAYYSYRNTCYFDFYVFKAKWIIVFVNSLLFMLPLFFFAIYARRMSTYAVFFKAYKDGIRKNLGYREDFPLEQP